MRFCFNREIYAFKICRKCLHALMLNEPLNNSCRGKSMKTLFRENLALKLMVLLYVRDARWSVEDLCVNRSESSG